MEKEKTNNEVEEDVIEGYMRPEDAKGNYSNHLRIGHNSTEFIMDFFMNTDHAFHTSRILVSPIMIKEFVRTIEKNIERYEEKYGIELPEKPSDYTDEGIQKSNVE